MRFAGAASGAVVALLLLGAPARAQVCSPDDSLRRTLPVNVLDEQGNLVRGLTPADFRGEFRGKAVKVLSVNRDAGSRRIVILLDASGSMIEPRARWQVACLAAEDVAAYAPPGSSFALLVFGSRVEATVHFAAGREGITAQLDTLGPDYEPPKNYRLTAVLDSIFEGFKLLESPRVGDVVFLVSDGEDTRSRIEQRQVETALLTGGVRIFGLHFESELSRITSVPVMPFVSAVFPNLVETTGGGLVTFGWRGNTYKLDEYDRVWLATWLRRLYQQMGDFYRLEVELPRAVDKLRGWKLEVVDERGKRRKGLTVVYPRKLAPCAPPPTP